ncbi:hypothetical protein KUTeg_009878 [Tegillarca granosa]|uniref:Methyltransferase type 11 domain-containing protein n=1 Tax=Tegillarca granosa TaxID=220873 RepID=A0ABQ9F890_TEGGR|nr:hypothetical protein KUTeg_009878 [Tegillarca granosa]
MTTFPWLILGYKISRANKLINSSKTIIRNISKSMNQCGLFKDSEHSKLYSKYRPTYPTELYDNIITYCKETRSELKYALDVGCGSGQSSIPLKAHFEKVIGIDVSQTQIDQAIALKNEGITYKVGSGEDLSFLGNASVDLVTVAQALHWIDTGKFYPEVSRILTPGGALVVYGYGTCSIDIQEAQNHFWEFYRETLNGYWDPRRQHIDNMMSDFELPFPEWKR